ncbi:unnamed protein product [Discula destructiva]
MVSKSGSKGRAFGSPAPSGFGGFSTASDSAGSLSYLSDPPDFSAISDSNIVVSFKSLLKKDNTTKSKALADLIQYAQAHPYDQDGGVEDPILNAWVQLYPRISIDNDRRVRELSHTLQFELLNSARKRMEKNIPKIAGAWLAGTFDRERAVARAASESLSAFLTTEDKVAQLWKKCQSQILHFATEAIVETPDTLSDERSTKAEDAEAKYYRVIAACLSLVHGLVARLSKEETMKFDSEYEAFFSSGPGDAAWSFATADDSRVRRNLYDLIQLCLEKRDDLIRPHIPLIAKILTSDALKKSQLGSAFNLVTVLLKLVKHDSNLWGTKKPPLSRLRTFIEKGSQGSPASFWKAVEGLLAYVPLDGISAEAASEFFKAFRTGINRREEPRAHAPVAWMCYLDALARIVQKLPDTASRIQVISTDLFPLTHQYLLSNDRQGEWSRGIDGTVLSRAYMVPVESVDIQVRESLAREWVLLAEGLVARLSNSLPEVSKEFEVSQKSIADDGKRWFSSIGVIHEKMALFSGQVGHEIADHTQPASWIVIRGAADLLKRRNYKPFGAAALLLSALNFTPYLFGENCDVGSWISLIPVDCDEEMDKLLVSPSASQIVAAAVTLGQQHSADYQTLWLASIRSLLRQDDNPQADAHLTKLISSPAARDVALNDPDLSKHLEKVMLSCAQGGRNSWELFDAALVWNVLPEPSLQTLALSIVGNLSSAATGSNMKAAEIMLKRQPACFADEALHLSLVTKLLGMMELTDPSLSSQARKIHSLLEKHSDAQPSVLSIIQENLERPGPESLGIDTLVDQAVALSKTSTDNLVQLFPDTDVWSRELSLFLQGPQESALALTSNIGGAYFLAHGTSNPAVGDIQRDQKGLSVPARMAMYTTSLLRDGIEIDELPKQSQVDLMYLLCLVAAIAIDQTTLMDKNKLFMKLEDPSLVEEVEDFVTTTRRTMNGIFAKSKDWRPGDGDGVVDGLVGRMIDSATSLEPIGIYSARALSEILQSFADAHGYGSSLEEWIAGQGLKASPSSVLPAVAILTGYGETLANSKAVSTLLNRLISDVAGAKSEADSTLLSLVLLNACMPIFELGQLPVANNRLVFAVKQITSWFEQGPETLGVALNTESCRALQRLLPCIGEVYGPYWDQTIDFCLSLWAQAPKDDPEDRLPYIHSSVKLLSSLRSFEEPNDDLVDALKSHTDATYQGILDLLKLPGSRSSRPKEIVDALLCREATKVPLDHLKDLTDIYGLVASDSREVQTAGFNLLHRALPLAQEQLSLDVLIEKKQAKLPDELTSLLLDAPTLDAYPEDLLVQFPTSIRSYLLSWKLVFDAYEGAAYKVRTDFTEDLKIHGAMDPLMEFMFDVLGHSAANPLNLDKEGLTADEIQDYDIKIADTLPEEKNMHWLLVHIFYLTLKFAPGLFKAWFLDCRSKQTKIAIEPWMSKYFSPMIVHDAIAEVEKWSKSQEVDSDEKELIIKVHYNTREVTAAYPIDDDGDEQQASILIKIKPNYPLDFVDVAGINRVGCSERTWLSWLRITQGIITISNGAIIDGLSTFRRNVVGALKGHVECAICYSFIAVDKKMPDKKCATCKNLFHRDCLFKWLNSANQNTCPLCRSKMDFVDKKKTTRTMRPPVDGF